MPDSAQPEWKSFEKAVAAFLAALDPTASVNHNVSIPDRDTGRPRQRDVWIEAKLLGHLPVAVLVSCKRYKRKLNQQDLDAFIGELRSSGAHKGVLYSYSGFSKPAIEKARALGVSCCRLIEDEPPELPRELVIPCYCFSAQIGLKLMEAQGWRAGLKTWGFLFEALVPGAEGRTVLDVLNDVYQDLERDTLERARPGEGPRALQVEFTLPLESALGEGVTLRLLHPWRIHEGRVEAYLVNGSYSETEGEFKGTTRFPVLDTQGVDPGPGWTPVEEVSAGGGARVYMIRSGGDVRDVLREGLADQNMPLGDGASS